MANKSETNRIAVIRDFASLKSRCVCLNSFVFTNRYRDISSLVTQNAVTPIHILHIQMLLIYQLDFILYLRLSRNRKQMTCGAKSKKMLQMVNEPPENRTFNTV